MNADQVEMIATAKASEAVAPVAAAVATADQKAVAAMTVANQARSDTQSKTPRLDALEAWRATVDQKLEELMAYTRGGTNRGTWSSGTVYNARDVVSFGNPASSFQATGAFTGGGTPAVDNSNANWALLAQAGAQGTQGVQGNQGTAGTNAAANVATASFTTAQNPIPSPAAGSFVYDVEFVPTAAISSQVCARQTGLEAVNVKNESATFAVTLTPVAGSTFDNGQTTSYVLNPGDAVTFRADPNDATSWDVS